jgi:hypothetical protein
MTQPYPGPHFPQAASQPPKKKGRGCLYAAIGFVVMLVVLVIIGAIASSGGDSTSPAPAKTPAATTTPARSAPAKAAPAVSLVKQFTTYTAKHGTANEVSAVKHVTKIQGADSKNDVLDSAEVYTDYTGDMLSSDASKGKLIASAFADWQASRGKDSKNGLVTVYNADADLLSNGNY